MTEQELKSDVRELTGYTDTMILSDDALDAAYRRAKNHLRVTAGLSAEGADFDWFATDSPEREEALYWWTCIFSKVATGELDAQTVQVGAVDAETLLSQASDEVTMWFRNAKQARRNLSSAEGNGVFQSVNVSRSGRSYGSDSTTGTGTTSGSGLSSYNLTSGN